MKVKYLALAVLALAMTACKQQPAQTVSEEPIPTRVFGHIDGQTDSIYISMDDSYDMEASVKGAYPVKDGDFEITVNPRHVCTFTIMDNEQVKNFQSIDPREHKMIQLFLMPGEDAEVTGTWKENTVKGSKFYDEAAEMQAFMKGLYGNLNAENYDSLIAAAKPKVMEYIKQHSKQEAAVIALSAFTTLDELNDALKLFDPAVANGRMQFFYKPMVKRFESAAAIDEAAKKIVEGAEALDFSLPDMNGKPVKLSDLRGKYVVLDFWGSWCGWCIKGFPDMKKYYEKYKDKMEILGVDCSDTEDKWKAAVEEHKANWKHVRQSEETDNVSELYGVSGFPTKIVIGPDGKIVKVVVGEDPAFYEFLDQLFK